VAHPDRRRPQNTDGTFYVDSTCIDCDTCRWMAPDIYARRDGQSAVVHQPETEAEQMAALKALVACPTASIGTEGAHPLAREAAASFPDPITDRVYHLGYHSESSFGATSYLLERQGGNVMIDSPRFNEGLARRIEEKGDVQYLYLTHRDDVADHARWADRLGLKRVLHRDDVTGDTKDVEIQLEGQAEHQLEDDLLVIPVAGHTKGHTVLLTGGYLFTGDHLAYSPRTGGLTAFRRACWYDWGEQTRSMKRLLEHRFEWVLPGHGRRHHAPADQMHSSLVELVAWMKKNA
jgi:glyoxylase-like metal-dependent hydrolase (beta-lactamase superfamily II)